MGNSSFVGFCLGHGDVAGGRDKFLELLVGHLGRVHPEAVHLNTPPGIHTIPSGAAAGAGVLLGIVGAKSALVGPALSTTSALAVAVECARGKPKTANAKTPDKTSQPATTQRTRFVSSPAGFRAW